MADNNQLDTMIEMMRASAPEDHPIHGADMADLRIAVAALIERKQMEESNG